MSTPPRFLGLIPAFILLVLALPAHGETLMTGGTGWSIGIAQILGSSFAATTGTEVTVAPSIGSSGGIGAVLEGAFGISFSARPLRDTEMAKGAVSRPLCRTPFVLAVSDVVDGSIRLTKTSIVEIFGRKVTQWPDGTQVGLVLRPARETDTRMLVENFPGIEPVLEHARETRGAVIVQSDQEAMDVGEQCVGSVVTTTLVAIRSEKRSLRPLRIDGVEPTLEALANGAYPMAITLNTVLGPTPGPLALDFLSFIESPTGRSILRENGCIPIDH